MIVNKIKKYWRIFAIFWQSNLEYRAELFVWTIVDAFPILAMVFIWLAVYRTGEKLGDYTLATLITYYLGNTIVDRLITSHFELHAVDEINRGNIVKHLVKPFSFIRHTIIAQTSWKIFSFFLTTLPIGLGLWVLARQWIILPGWHQLPQLTLFLLLGYFIDMLFSFLVVIGAFYFEQARSLTHAKWIFTGIFSGSLLPLDVYPHWLERLARFLPFQYLRAVPLELYIGRTSQSFFELLLPALIWLAVLVLIFKLLWDQAMKKFTAVGQ